MLVGLVFAVSVAVVVLAAVGWVPWLVALPAAMVCVAVLVGYLARRGGAPEPPSHH